MVEAIYRQIRQDILSGKLKPGSKLRFADLKTSYDAGTSTLREALSRLTADCLVTVEGQRGFRVAPISLTELWDITKLRAEIESTALADSIEHGDDSWEANVLASLHRLSKYEDRDDTTPALLSEEGALLHKLFHMSLLSACPSVWRLRVLDLLYDQSERYRRLQTSYLPDYRNSPQEHRDLMEATIGRHKQRAVALLTLHLEKTAQSLATVEELWGPEARRQGQP
ncbi:GntR family transcriptional regulator [Ferrovibrio xuzhouensis]|uniref:GntR family transcriptional regulator n=1 Tax=Ferrovibrio xuzhouensis TaxID=1576914 RepID=A0ABV7VJ98_9PROT